MEKIDKHICCSNKYAMGRATGMCFRSVNVPYRHCVLPNVCRAFFMQYLYAPYKSLSFAIKSSKINLESTEVYTLILPAPDITTPYSKPPFLLPFKSKRRTFVHPICSHTIRHQPPAIDLCADTAYTSFNFANGFHRPFT